MDFQLLVVILALGIAAVVSLYQLVTGKKSVKELGQEAAFGLRGHSGEVPNHLKARGAVGERIVQNLTSADPALVRKLRVGPAGPRGFVQSLLDGEPKGWLALAALTPEERRAVLGGDNDPARSEPTAVMKLLGEEHGIDMAGFSEDEAKAVALHLSMKG